jgi:hypothetical protein
VLARPLPAEWERRLRQISPKTRQLSYLAFRWYAKEERWVLYECVPRECIWRGNDIVRMLEDRPPRLLPKEQRLGRMFFVSEYTHEMYRLHKVWARPVWVIQGKDGGHPVEFIDAEQQLLRLRGLPTEPPPIGALEYAPFDERVVERIASRDRLIALGNNLDRLKRTASNEVLKAEAVASQRQFRAEYLKWMEDMMSPQSDFLTWYTRKTEADMTLRKATRREMSAASRLKDEFIETGLVPA